MSDPNASQLNELEIAATSGDALAQLELGSRYLAAARYGTEAFSTGLRWLTQAAEQNLPEAQWMLGNVYAHSSLLPNATRSAFNWYSKAAAQHSAPAHDRLADLYMLGRGIAADDREALRWYTKSAEQALPVAQANLAYMHAHGIGTPPDQDEATTWYLRAAAMGNARAYFNLGLRYAAGIGTCRSTIHAIALLQSTARQDYPLSKLMVERLSTGLSNEVLADAAMLAGRINANFQELRQTLGPDAQNLDASSPTKLREFNRRVERHFACLDEPALSLDAALRHSTPGDVGSFNGFNTATKVHVWSWQPRVFQIDNFLSLDECAHVMDVAASQLINSKDYHLAQSSAETTTFNGEAMVFDAPLCDAALRNIERRIALYTRMPKENIEPLSVLRYLPGHEYSAHVDFFREERLHENEAKLDHGGQRLMTFLVYLRAPEEGGETEYINADCKIAGRTGMAALHYNCLPSNQPDELTAHRGRPIVSGEKWLLRTAIREHSLYDL